MVLLCDVSKIGSQEENDQRHDMCAHQNVITRYQVGGQSGLARTYNLLSFFDACLDLGNVSGRVVITEFLDILLSENG